MELTEEQLKNMSPEEIAELQKKNCIFCQIIAGGIPARKIYEDEELLAVLDINPANPGHIIIIPKTHYQIMPQVPDALIGKLFLTAKSLSQAALRGLGAEGTTIFVANGVAAGQKAPHFMVHIIPRIKEDFLELSIPERNTKEGDLVRIKSALQIRLKQTAAPEQKVSVRKEKTVKEKAVKAEPKEKEPKPKKEKAKPEKKTAEKAANLDRLTELLGGKDGKG